MQTPEITEDMIFECFAAASQHADSGRIAESFVDVEEYENQIMYPEFACWAEKVGYHDLATLFRRVAGEAKLHAVWLRKLYTEMGGPTRGEDTQRAIDALATIRANCDSLIGLNPDGVVEKALSVAVWVEEREALSIYPKFRDQALAEGNHAAAEVYQRVVDDKVHNLYASVYDNEPFVHVLPLGSQATFKHIQRANTCEISVTPINERYLHITITLDNLRKGAASQAVQCFNLMMNLPETEGLL